MSNTKTINQALEHVRTCRELAKHAASLPSGSRADHSQAVAFEHLATAVELLAGVIYVLEGRLEAVQPR